MKKPLLSFAVGSSLIVTIFPLATLLIASWGKPLDLLDWRIVFLVFPVVFGLANLLTTEILHKTTAVGFALVGALMGLALASTGTFVFNVPEIVYGIEGSARYSALLVGPALYALVWALVMFPVDRYLGLISEPGPRPGSSQPPRS